MVDLDHNPRQTKRKRKIFMKVKLLIVKVEKQMLWRLPIPPAQVKVDNTNCLLLYQSIETTKKVYNDVMNSIEKISNG